MSKCEECKSCKNARKGRYEYPCNCCKRIWIHETDRFEPQTNADRIRNMTDDELAEFMTGDALRTINCCDCDEPESKYGSCIGDCKNPWLKWLQAEVKEGESNADS